MDLCTLPKIMAVCVVLIHSIRLVSSVEPQKGASPTSQSQPKTGTGSTPVSQSSIIHKSSGTLKSSQIGRPKTPAIPEKSNNGQSQLKTENSKNSASTVSSKETIPSSTQTRSHTQSKENNNESRDSKKEQKPKDKMVPVDLDIKKKEKSEHCTYNLQDKTATFVPETGYCFKLVKQDTVEIWSTEKETEYSTKVVVFGISSNKKKLSIYLVNGTVKNFSKPSKNKSYTESSLLELNLKDKKTVYEYDYLKDDASKTTTYNTKHGFLFSSVKHNKDEIWKTTQPFQYSNKVVFKDLGSDKLDLTLCPPNHTKITFNKPNKNDPWKETTPLKVLISTLDNNGNTKENDISQYKMKEESDGLYKCEFKKGSKCTEFKHNKNSIWKYNKDEFGDNYPTEVVFKLDEVTLKSPDLILKFVYKNDKWTLESKSFYDGCTNKLFTLVTSEKEDCSNTSENNHSHYDITFNFNDRFMVFFKDGVKLLELKYDNAAVWKHNEDIYGDQYPESIIYRPGVSLCLDLYPFYFTYNFDSTTNNWALNSHLSHKASLPLDVSEHPSYITIITEDEYGTNPKVNDTSKYKVCSLSDGMYLYSFNKGTNCVEVKYVNQTIWKVNESRNQKNLPKTISVDTHEPSFEIEFEDQTLGFKLTEEGPIRYTVKNDKTYYSSGLSLGSGKDSTSDGGLTSRNLGRKSVCIPTTPTSDSSSYRKPPVPPPTDSNSPSQAKPNDRELSGSQTKPTSIPKVTHSSQGSTTKNQDSTAKTLNDSGKTNTHTSQPTTKDSTNSSLNHSSQSTSGHKIGTQTVNSKNSAQLDGKFKDQVNTVTSGSDSKKQAPSTTGKLQSGPEKSVTECTSPGSSGLPKPPNSTPKS